MSVAPVARAWLADRARRTALFGAPRLRLDSAAAPPRDTLLRWLCGVHGPRGAGVVCRGGRRSHCFLRNEMANASTSWLVVGRARLRGLVDELAVRRRRGVERDLLAAAELLTQVNAPRQAERSAPINGYEEVTAVRAGKGSHYHAIVALESDDHRNRSLLPEIGEVVRR